MSEGSTIFVGLDVHKESINVAMLGLLGREAVQWQLANEPVAVSRFIRRLQREGKEGAVRCFYEAGPCGYALKRELEKHGIACEVVAPALIPVKAGDRVKTDRRDARKLAELGRAGLLTEVIAPTEAQEAVRDLCRARLDAQEDLVRSRHRVSKFLLRHGLKHSGRAWTGAYRRWLRGLRFTHRAEKVTFDEYVLTVEQHEERLKRLDGQLAEISEEDAYRAPVGSLRCFRGIDTLTAMVIVTELHDIRRFSSARALMAYAGLVPSEYSSGGNQRRGSITKTGNAHLRRVLVESAWHYRHWPSVGPKLRKRREGQPLAAISIAEKTQQRLHRRFERLVERGKPTNKAVVAIARELAGFVWAALQSSAAVQDTETAGRAGRPPLPTGEATPRSTRGLRRGATL